MFKNIYNRCKMYLNSNIALVNIFIMFLFLILPIFAYKESNSFFFIIRYTYQFSLVNVLIILLYIFNIWNYLNKNISVFYQTHRYGSVKRVVRHNICDVVFIGLILDFVFMILNISIAIFLNDGYYLSLYKYYEITNLEYLIYIVFIRFIFVSIISILVYFLYYTDSKRVKIILATIIAFNLFDVIHLPVSMNVILSGYEFKTFISEILVTLVFVIIYIVFLLAIKKRIVNKKRDIG